MFVSDRLGYSQLFRMAADGSGYAALSPTFGGEQWNPSPHPLVDNQLLFTSERGGSQDIWSMSVSAIDGSVTALLEIRIQKGTLWYQLRNALNREYELVPGFTMPRPINVYGVRWEFWN